jgi:hypothetical protein
VACAVRAAEGLTVGKLHLPCARDLA